MRSPGARVQPPRPARADARRNHERLLAAARTVFVTYGVNASLNDVARRAGVGPATLYRHFPTREALLEALLADRYNDLTTQAHALLASPSPLDALAAWLRAFISHASAYRGLVVPVTTALHDERSALFSSCHAMQAAWHELLTHAQEAGTVRADLHAWDLLKLANAIAWTTEELPDTRDQADRLLSLVLEGIQHRPSPP